MSPLKKKILSIFDVLIPEGTSDKAIIKELNRRGKVDQKKITDIIFLLIEEIDHLKEPKV